MAVPLADHAPPTPSRNVGIITPEAVVLEFETAGVASRLLARLLDGLVLWLGFLAFAIALAATGPIDSQAIAIVMVVLLLFFVVFGYWILLETILQGRTLGKMALGLRVVTVEGAPVRLRHSIIRAIVGLVDFLLPPLGPVAVVSVLVNGRDQRLGDMAAGTIVLRERSSVALATSVQMVEPHGEQELMGRLQLARLTEPQHNLIRRFLVRTPTLTPSARIELATALADEIVRATGVPRPSRLHPEWYLHAAGLAHQRRAGLAGGAGAEAPPPPVGAPYGGPQPPQPPPAPRNPLPPPPAPPAPPAVPPR